MKFSSRTKYGLRAIVNLAQVYGQKSKPLSLIAKEEKISFAYLEQIFSLLRKQGLVKASRGVQGGYQLAKKPNKITVGQIVNTLEGPFAPVACIVTLNNCPKSKNCKTKLVWQRIDHYLKKALDSLTLKDLVS